MTRVRKGAIIGFGNDAANGHVPGWLERRDFRIVAVSDCDAQRRTAAAGLLGGVHTYTTTEELLANEELDFVDIATPPAFHSQAIIAAAKAGVHVLCEKPLTTAVAEYRDVHAAVSHAGVVLHTVHNWKYSEAFRAVQLVLSQGGVGALKAISFDTARNGCAASNGNWRMQAATAGGGILVDHGWHAFYLLLALANEQPSRVGAVVERRRYVDAEVEDTAVCRIDFPSLAAQISLTWAASERRTCWQLIGDGGRLVVDDDRLIVERQGTQHSQVLQTALSAGSHHPEWFAGVVESFRRELDDPEARGANQAETEWCLLMLSLAYASGAQGSRPLTVPPRRTLWEGSGMPL